MNAFISVVLLLSALVVVPGTALGTPGACGERVPRRGMNHDFVWTVDEDIHGLVRALKDAHVQIVRIPLRWTVVEPEEGKWDYAKVDMVVKELQNAGIEVLADLMSVPPRASGIDGSKVEGFVDCYAPKRYEDWAEFVRRSVDRYKNDIHYWEVWNEENGPDFYRPLPDATEYVKILRTAHNAITRADPKAVVVLGGLQFNGIIPNPWLPVKVENFLQKIYDAGGRPYFDVVNIHPYVLPTREEGPAYCAKLTRDTVEVMRRNGDAEKPLWITETGAATNADVTEEMQARHLSGVYRELSKIPEVKAIYWFTLRDYPKSICGGEDSMGLIAVDGRRKPAFEAYKSLP